MSDAEHPDFEFEDVVATRQPAGEAFVEPEGCEPCGADTSLVSISREPTNGVSVPEADWDNTEPVTLALRKNTKDLMDRYAKAYARTYGYDISPSRLADKILTLYITADVRFNPPRRRGLKPKTTGKETRRGKKLKASQS